MARSAVALTVVLSVLVLSAGFRSVSVSLAVAVLDSVEPFAALAETFTTTWKVAEALALGVAIVARAVVPALPGAGGVRANAGPAVWAKPPETNVVLAGIVSVRCTLAAAAVPVLLTVIV